MKKSEKLISSITSFGKYSKHQAHLGRRESLEETINRNMNMHLDRFPKLSKDIIKAYQRVHELKLVPSMRTMQFAGDAILKNNARLYNCSYLPIDDVRAFGETLFLLLSGVGVGFSVQRKHIYTLPQIMKPQEEGIYVAHDSIIGWAKCIDQLFDAYMFGQIRPVFDLSKIRPKGSYLVTTGSKAPGPEPLRIMLEKVEAKLKSAVGRKLKPIEVHDILCLISDSVLAGGIRRAAMISLFDRTDKEMLNCKSGSWWDSHPERARANNSAVLPREEVTREEFYSIFDACRASGSGEPGFSWTNNTDWGYNPCHEISLNPFQFCNLTSVNQTGVKDKKDFFNRIYAASLIGTMQSSYTDFHYLRPKWKEITEKEALLGVSFTGIADNQNIDPSWLREGAALVLEVNEKYAKKMDINLAARTTTIKPEGTSSCVLASSSGIHARHAEFYLRRMRFNVDDPIAVYLSKTIPELVEPDLFSNNTVVITIPQQSPEGAITRHQETAENLFKRTLQYSNDWVSPGHRSGDNKHNVSVTISVKDNEWDNLREQMWNNRENYSGISLLPFDGGSYQQAPFEDCSKETYEKYESMCKDIDLKQIREETDNTNRIENIACGPGGCEVT